MKIEIDQETQRVTTRCEKQFACLKSQEGLCKIKSCRDGYIHFVQCAELGKCSYQSPFGSAQLCECPTRKEIYATYYL